MFGLLIKKELVQNKSILLAIIILPIMWLLLRTFELLQHHRLFEAVSTYYFSTEQDVLKIICSYAFSYVNRIFSIIDIMPSIGLLFMYTLQSISSDWQENNMFFWRSLPIPVYKLVLNRLAVVVLAFLAIVVIKSSLFFIEIIIIKFLYNSDYLLILKYIDLSNYYIWFIYTHIGLIIALLPLFGLALLFSTIFYRNPVLGGGSISILYLYLRSSANYIFNLKYLGFLKNPIFHQTSIMGGVNKYKEMYTKSIAIISPTIENANILTNPPEIKFNIKFSIMNFFNSSGTLISIVLGFTLIALSIHYYKRINSR
jgi:hypothetical protein